MSLAIKRLASFFGVAAFLVSPAALASQPVAPQTNSFVIAQASRITAQRAQDAVSRLPEVQQKVKQIQRLSKGKVRVGLMVEGEPTRSEPYYSVQVYENHPEHMATIYRFRVSSPGGVITVLDNLSGEYISLKQWRNANRKTGQSDL